METLFDYPVKSKHQTEFEKFDEANPFVWELFVKFTMELIRAGRTRYSADSILHRIRWETAVKTTDETFKINNNFSAFYARKFMSVFTMYDGFFELRKSKAD